MTNVSNMGFSNDARKDDGKNIGLATNFQINSKLSNY